MTLYADDHTNASMLDGPTIYHIHTWEQENRKSLPRELLHGFVTYWLSQSYLPIELSSADWSFCYQQWVDDN